jgi:membrane-bound serine protease (ClpP class)
MTRLIAAALLSFLFPALLPAQDTPTAPPPEPSPSKLIYVIPIKDAIEDALVYVVRRGVKEAIDAKADILILHMDTPGGKVSSTLEIFTILSKFPHQDQTYTLIDRWAISAGAFISAATRNIYMTPGAVIGAAAPVMVAPGGGVQEMPSTMEEKQNSALRAQIRALAELHGHNKDVFNAMVDKDQGLKIDGKTIVEPGKIVTLTTQEAAQTYGNPPKPLLSSGTVQSLDELVRKIGGPDARVVKIEPTGFERLARFIVMLSPFLLSAALLCGYIEFKTPGFGVFGAIGIVLALLFFFGHSIAGLSGHEHIIIFLIGVALIAVELFFLPGFLVPGLIGVLLVLFAVLKAMVDRYPTDPLIPTLPMLQLPLTNLAIALAVTLTATLALARFLPRSPLADALVLDKVNPTELPIPATAPAPGTLGRSLSALRPSGNADFGNGPVEVTTEGEFLPPGTPIQIVRVEGNRILVRSA